MKRKNENVSYKDRYKHKLNMIGPGQIMAKIILCLFLVGVVFYFLNFIVVSIVLFAISAAMLLVLLILVAVELHQDKVLYEIAKKENSEIK